MSHRKLISLLVALALPGLAAAQTHLDNPFVGATMYVNPDYTANADGMAAQESDSTLAARMRLVGRQNTAVWMDRISAVPSLEKHLDQALAQGANLFLGVVYDLPGRDCHALASNGELPGTIAGLNRYKTEYIDPIVATASNSKYAGIRIVFVVEPDSLPNLVTNMSDADCAAVAAAQTGAPDGIYIEGIRYAVNKLHAIPNVYLYIDSGHSGWLGWPNNFDGWITMMNKVANGFTAGKNAIEGFVDDTANTLPTKEPFLSPGMTIGGQDIKSSKFLDWNPYPDEQSFSAALYNGFVAAGWPRTLGILHDTSRNGWGGSSRTSAASTSTDVNTYVNASKVDRRAHRGLWCNPLGAGIGHLPTAAPSDWPNSHFDAYAWVKPPGESDGASKEIPNDQGKGFDRMCDPTYTTEYGVLTGATPDAPLSGDFFPAQFRTLVQNIYPVPGAGAVCQSLPAAPSGLTVGTRTGSEVSLSWTAASPVQNCTLSYTIHAGTTYNFTPSASTRKAAGLTTTSYTVTGLTPNTTYYFMVQSVNELGTVSSTYVQTNTTNGYSLNVTKTGTGTVSGGGINCGSTCSVVTNPGVTLTLTASTTATWTGCQSSTATSCVVLMDTNRNVTAALSGGGTTYDLTVTKAGTGSGTVSSSPTGVSCGSACTASFSSGTNVTLSAVAASGSTFAGWGGACTGNTTCSVTMTAARNVTATFNADQPGGETPVAKWGRLRACGNKICNAAGTPVQLKGMSWFWSNTWWAAERFYNADAVKNLASTWGATVVRAALGVHGGGGYYSGDAENPADPSGNKARIITLIDAAIANGVYVIVDWHSHELHQEEAVAFFRELATTYANVPNIIWEPYNEPTTQSWTTLKAYHEAVIAAIRGAGSQNLVVLGNPNWSQDVDVATANPVSDTNVAYTLHFYAGTHTSWLREKANTAMSRGLPVFVTEYGTCDASGDGGFNATESANWFNWMDQNMISSANWSMHDKEETASALVSGASATGPWSDSELTQSGKLVKAYIQQSAPVTYSLTVAKNGTATGTVTSSVGGINCGSTCSATFTSATTVTLSATPASGASVSWAGCTSTSGNSCVVAVSGATTVTATFTAGQTTQLLTVSKGGTGTGTVTGGGIDCGSTCSANVTTNASVTLTAAATSPSTFTSWSGCNSTSGLTCVVTMNAAKTVTATFTAPEQNYVLTVNKGGTGTGTVTGGGISCGSTCSATIAANASVTLTAQATSPSTFTSWTGCNSTSGNTCVVTMNAAKTVTAAFTGTTSGGCKVTYSLANQWPGGFQGGITVANTSTSAWTNWTLTFTFANGQQISQMWGAAVTQSGANVTAKSLDWNGNVPAGGSFGGIGFLGSWNGTNSAPTGFAVNGVPCN